ncbi:MAG: hypothetical protein EKK40_16175 [Bradyrhizobiaceae bacterium]|nr:MAG: hypothetical protein EKK40_16175 [Bradyrhizobiaceae bacterium]
MRGSWRLFVLSVVFLAAVWFLERLLVPGIVPIAWADHRQPLWAVETAFVLRSLKILAAGIALLSLVFSLAVWGRRQVQSEPRDLA